MSEPTALAFDEREFTLAELDALANGMATTLEHLTMNVTEKRTALGALDVELGTLERERSQHAHALATEQAELQATRTALGKLQQELDRGLLAESVTELQKREAALQQRLSQLDAELGHNTPLFERSVDVSREIATLDEQLRSLTQERANLADELADLVTRIEEPATGEGRGATAAPATNDDIADVTGD